MKKFLMQFGTAALALSLITACGNTDNQEPADNQDPIEEEIPSDEGGMNEQNGGDTNENGGFEDNQPEDGEMQDEQDQQ
ncbi:hypothetical protein M3E13_01960 [Oceanobacillus kimchii]|uniref:hypothetical protein n=1 Tax=Oceanobacillus TaxID=182709 RepID=UPI001BE54CD9|nr:MULTISPECIES: hypothetical protein [Oceanobacillus]MBT2599410.1 hypothetical protein [Oceanobacillus sp. ISL-74]MCT1576598.1 hypothetical protein [Oceanobacillus kimchii]MCT2134668.1 hypothetical protein [Oceanobacillus kimchii]